MLKLIKSQVFLHHMFIVESNKKSRTNKRNFLVIFKTTIQVQASSEWLEDTEAKLPLTSNS